MKVYGKKSTEALAMSKENPVGDPFFKVLAAAPLLSQIAARNLYTHAATPSCVDQGQNVYARLGVKNGNQLPGNVDFPERLLGISGGSPCTGGGLQVFREHDRIAAGRGAAMAELTGAESGIVTSRIARSDGGGERPDAWPARTTTRYWQLPDTTGFEARSDYDGGS